MRSKGVRSARSALAWAALAAAICVPLALAGASPLLAWRSPVYIAACFAGVVSITLLLIQPLLIGGYLPGLSQPLARRAHRIVGLLLVLSVVVHVGGLWVTSPPDVIDALLFSSPTPFSNWGVVAMWALFATALLAMFRRRLPLSPRNWRIAHSVLAIVIVSGTVVHAVLIEGTMETVSKVSLCALAVAATMKALSGLKIWSDLKIRATRRH